jgi:transposase
MGNRRFEMYEYRQVLLRLRLGGTDREVARAQRIGRAKVAHIRQLAGAQGWLEPSDPMPDDTQLAAIFKVARTAAQNVSSVEAFRDDILAWHAQGIQVTTIRQALARIHGFDGSVHSVYRFLRQAAPTTPAATVMLDFAVADTAQVDFGQGPLITDRASGEVIKTWIFVMTLAWSRHQYAEIVPNQKVETWLACHRHAFEWFNGVPKKIAIDNPKCAITRACYYEPQVQRSYSECALGYGFIIAPCPPRDPQKKGRVEAGVKYVKNNFVPLREFHSLAHANEQLQAWILGEAGNRIHGTTRAQPLALFSTTEQPLLQPLPTIAPACAVWAQAKLHGNCHVQYELCYYSAPFRWLHQALWLEVGPSAIRIYHDHELVAVHPRLFKPGERSTVQDHLPPDAQAYFMRDPQWCLAQAALVGPACRAVIDSMFGKGVLDYLRAAQGLLGLRERYSASRLEAACARALNFGVPTYRTVKQILKEGLDQQPTLLTTELEAPYRGGARFARAPSQRLH